MDGINRRYKARILWNCLCFSNMVYLSNSYIIFHPWENQSKPPCSSHYRGVLLKVTILPTNYATICYWTFVLEFETIIFSMSQSLFFHNDISLNHMSVKTLLISNKKRLSTQMCRTLRHTDSWNHFSHYTYYNNTLNDAWSNAAVTMLQNQGRVCFFIECCALKWTPPPHPFN